jgi:rubrerythrin
MRFEQSRTILKKLAPEYHRSVSQYFQQMAEGTVSPRVQLMLDYLIDHELHRALALKEFCEEASPQALDHWHKGLEIAFPIAEAGTINDKASTDLDHLLCAAITYKTDLINYFEHLLEKCTDNKTSKLFLSLKNQEEKAMKRLIRHAQGLADL